MEIPSKSWGDRRRLEAKDIRIPGFRVQLFMGKLDSARQLKRSLELKALDQPIYVTPYPPLFGVTVGNFTTSLAAHRVREAWRPRFPNALQPLDLPLDAVFPPGNSRPMAPFATQTPGLKLLAQSVARSRLGLYLCPRKSSGTTCLES